MENTSIPTQNVLNYRKKTRLVSSSDLEKLNRDIERIEKRLAKIEKGLKK